LSDAEDRFKEVDERMEVVRRSIVSEANPGFDMRMLQSAAALRRAEAIERGEVKTVIDTPAMR